MDQSKWTKCCFIYPFNTYLRLNIVYIKFIDDNSINRDNANFNARITQSCFNNFKFHEKSWTVLTMKKMCCWLRLFSIENNREGNNKTNYQKIYYYIEAYCH
jgi:hypothetical protein